MVSADRSDGPDRPESVRDFSIFPSSFLGSGLALVKKMDNVFCIEKND